MKCKCGAEYSVTAHKDGFYIRCDNWRSHQQHDDIIKAVRESRDER